MNDKNTLPLFDTMPALRLNQLWRFLLVFIGVVLVQGACRGVEAPLAHLPEMPRDPRILAEIGATAAFTAPHKVEEIRWSADGRWFFTADKYRPLVTQFDAKSGLVQRRIQADMRTLAASAEAIVAFEKLAEGSSTPGRFGCWNLHDLSGRWVVPDVSSVAAVCFSPDGKRVAVSYQTTKAPTKSMLPNGQQRINYSGSQKSQMALLDTAMGKELWRTDVQSLPSALAFVTDNLIVARIHGFEIYDALTGQKSGKLADSRGHTPDPKHMLCDANPRDGTILLAWEGECQMWRVSSAQQTTPLLIVRPDTEGIFRSASLSRADGSVFILTNTEGRIYAPAERGRFRKVTESAWLSAASPAGDLIAMTHGPQVSIVPTTTWTRPVQPAVFEHGVKRMEFNADGTLLAAATCGKNTPLGQILFFDAESYRFAGRLESVDGISSR